MTVVNILASVDSGYVSSSDAEFISYARVWEGTAAIAIATIGYVIGQYYITYDDGGGT